MMYENSKQNEFSDGLRGVKQMDDEVKQPLTEKKEGRTKLQIAAEVVFVLVLLLVMSSIRQLPGAFKAAHKYKAATTGVAVEIEYLPLGTEPKGYEWRVTIDYTVDGEHFRIHQWEGNLSHPQTGDSYRIWYNKNAPSEAWVGSDAQRVLKLYALNTLIGLGICIICFKIRWGKNNRIKE